MKYPGHFRFNMPFYRQGDRIGCGLHPWGNSMLKQSGLLARQYCMKCGFRCWIYYGQRYRYIETEVKVDNDQSFYFAINR